MSVGVIGVLVGNGVSVGLGVSVGGNVLVGAGVGVDVRVAVGLGVAIGSGVLEGLGLFVGALVGVGVAVGVLVAAARGVLLAVAEADAGVFAGNSVRKEAVAGAGDDVPHPAKASTTTATKSSLLHMARSPLPQPRLRAYLAQRQPRVPQSVPFPIRCSASNQASRSLQQLPISLQCALVRVLPAHDRVPDLETLAAHCTS